jgi:flavin reductase (DIM6/NTAB) family NADH-FMN oxidoreductase RutF
MLRLAVIQQLRFSRLPLSRPVPLIPGLTASFSFPTQHTRSMASKENQDQDRAKHNPHPDFKTVEAGRPPWRADAQFHHTKTVNPDWKAGDGANQTHNPSGAKHIAIDPYEEGRPPTHNYKLLISSVIPRPIAFVSTRGPPPSPAASSGTDAKAGEPASSHRPAHLTPAAASDGYVSNLAPFSYFQVIAHDPPLFTIGFACGLATPSTKDTLRNLRETGECVINIISEGFVEAANATSVNAPLGASEWTVSGLTPVHDCVDVKCARVGEAVFSVECKLESLREFESRATPGKKTTVLAIVEGTRFWVREDAINEDKNIVDPAVSLVSHRLTAWIIHCADFETGLETNKQVGRYHVRPHNRSH